jgi:hypothetical protein
MSFFPFDSSPFEYQAWSNFFQCAITFITQPALQVEKFSETKKMKILGQVRRRLQAGEPVLKGQAQFGFSPHYDWMFL